MSVVVFIGTKAQFIKTAPVLLEMDRRGVPYTLVYTGQHSETFNELEQAFGTRPADDVLVPKFEAATKLKFLRWTLRFWWEVGARLWRGDWKEGDIGIVHGDTASTLFGALAMRLSGVKVGHVEAGLRSPKILDPFPEEGIRRLVSRISHIHFVPDATAEANLARSSGHVINTHGNTLKDALMMALGKIAPSPESGGAGGYAVVSLHRNENLSRNAEFSLLMQSILDASRTIPVKFVLHPATREKLSRGSWGSRLKNAPGIELLDRMDYPAFIRLLTGARFLMTDGGSNQEEAAMLGLPTLLLRRTTERADGLNDEVVLSNLD